MAAGAEPPEISKARQQLEQTRASLARWSPEAFAALTPEQQSLHQRSFTTNSGDKDWHRLETLTYQDGGTARHMKVPAGDVLHQFREDVRTGKLPAVSWLVAPQHFSDHPESPWYGAWYLAEAFDILTKNPEIWRKTIFILCYDENDGWFDHVPPFTAPVPGQPDTGATSPAYANMVGPFGGVTAASALNAVLQHPALLGEPVALTVNYAAALADGPFEVVARPARTNRSTQHWVVEIVQAGETVLTATALTAAAAVCCRGPQSSIALLPWPPTAAGTFDIHCRCSCHRRLPPSLPSVAANVVRIPDVVQSHFDTQQHDAVSAATIGIDTVVVLALLSSSHPHGCQHCVGIFAGIALALLPSLSTRTSPHCTGVVASIALASLPSLCRRHWAGVFAVVLLVLLP